MSDLFQTLLKEFLKTSYILTLNKGSFSAKEFSINLNRTEEEGESLLTVLIGLKLIRRVPDPLNHYSITQGGKNNLKVVLTGGVFDIIHLGHINTLKTSKEGADVLVVVVASDNMVESSKGRPPLNNQANRMSLLGELMIVDIVAKGDPDSTKFLDSVREYEPDTIVLGYDQTSTEEMLMKYLENSNIRNIEIKKLKSHVPNEKSSLKKEKLDKHSFD
ncbi:MAG: adenylyltransferase/cytidyltransferase family protein [Candidatus Hodarchaeales archaeon]